MPTLSIDGKRTTVPDGATVLEAARSAGREIPTLCYHPELRPYGACRLCTVEVTQEGRTRLQASCAMPAEEGMAVATASERVLAGRRVIVELLLSRSPDAPRLRELAARVGARHGRVRPKNEKCILCGLCVGVCAEILGARAIGFAGRGVTRRVTTPFDGPGQECLACGACASVCPTGAIAMERRTLERIKAEGSPRYCRYMRMRMVPYAICSNAFECYRCEVDQRMVDSFGTHPAFVARPARRLEPIEVHGYLVMPERHYHPAHVWVERIDGHVRLGVDDFAQRLLGGVVEVRPLKERGADVQAGEILWELLLAKGRTARLRAPLAGQLVRINDGVLRDPTLLGKAPFSRGWMCLVRPAQADAELAALRYRAAAVPYFRVLDADPVGDWLGEEVEKLQRLLAGRTGEVLTDGGVPRRNLPEVLSEDDWRQVTKTFFGA
ncbi:MAG: (2Fe-2S)-binding protein [Deltaproteobacteria bacterium]|nr:(2Fe-2S)-binding protein [Deltaproteobacteria bacterium]